MRITGKCASRTNAKGGEGLDPGTVMEGIGSYGAGLIDVEDLYKIECHSLPSAGTCSAMFTACTMASVVEALGTAPRAHTVHALPTPCIPTARRR